MRLPVSPSSAARPARLAGAALVCLASWAGAAPLPAAAGTYREGADAPDLVPGEPTRGAGPGLDRIHGSLSDSLDVDVFCIRVVTPGVFSARAGGAARTGFDAQLFLFDAGGLGVIHNDDEVSEEGFEAALDAAGVSAPGVYSLAVSEYDRDAVGAGGLLLWETDPPNFQRAPDGPGAPGPLLGWTGEGDVSGGEYWIELTGCAPCDGSGPQAGVWIEGGDAGELPPGQPTVGEGALLWIYGDLGDPADVDLFAMDVVDPLGFRAEFSARRGHDAQLWLFGPGGMPIVMNDDSPVDTTASPALSGVYLPGPGTYLLAVSSFDRDAFDLDSSEIWEDVPHAEERAPDGPGLPLPLGAWSGDGRGQSFYGIGLAGAEFLNEAPVAAGGDVPAPFGPRLQVGPTPFAPSTIVRSWAAAAGSRRVAVYDVAGRLVRVLQAGPAAAGELAVAWDGRDEAGRPAASGVYYVTLEAAGTRLARRVVLLR